MVLLEQCLLKIVEAQRTLLPLLSLVYLKKPSRWEVLVLLLELVLTAF